MLKKTRLTLVPTTRCVSPNKSRPWRRVVPAAVPAIGALLFLLPEVRSDAFAADAGLLASSAESSASSSTSRLPSRPSTPPQTERQRRFPSSADSSQSPLSVESDLVRELDQLEFQFQQAQKIDAERLDELTRALVPLLDKARQIVAPSDSAPEVAPEVAERAAAFIAQLEEFQRDAEESAPFFEKLAEFDAASLEPQSTRAFFASFLSERDAAPTPTSYSSTTSNSSPPSASLAGEYRSELRRAARALDALQTVATWNAFVETNGRTLERFYVAPDAAEKALEFLSQTVNQQGLPQEFQIVERRAAEWRFATLNRVAIQRKILLALESELAVKYWTFAPSPTQIYYLPQPPRPGRNVCFADSNGRSSLVDVPSNAPETTTSESTQRLFLQSLSKEARSIPETLRADDAARWYAAWSAFLSRLQTTDQLDPLVQFRLLHSVASILSSGDFYFAQRLEPTLRMLNVPRLVEPGAFDVFQAEDVATQELRRLARSRVAFLPTDRLTVAKTTEQLDAQTPRFSFVYRQIGWLDRDFSGAWRCRRPENAPLPVGDLYVLLPEKEDATGLKQTSYNARPFSFLSDASTNLPSDSVPRPFRWLKIGSSDGRKITLEFAAPDVCRGTIVLCRSRVGALPNPVAKQDELERVLRR